MLSYCPTNISISTVWSGSSFSDCFLTTLVNCILAGLMLFFGNFEFMMYYRFGSRVDGRMKEYTLVYSAQLIAMTILTVSTAIYTLIYAVLFQMHVVGYLIFAMISRFYMWLMSIILVRLERNFDLPTPPVRGHSLFLIVFWTAAVVCDSLFFINTSIIYWETEFNHIDRIIGFTLFLLQYSCTLATFILGILAPGRPSLEQRFQLAYKNNAAYGAMDRTDMDSDSVEIGFDIDLKQSIDMLKSMLESGEAVRTFDRLMKQKPNLKIAAGSRVDNRSRNRYLNVVPYDATRVLLQESPDGNTYINASRMILNIPSSDISRHYIATQGPLTNTAADFWQMIFDNMTGMIIMVTDTSEGGVNKCYKYWPLLNECREYNKLVVSCIREDDPSTAYFVRKPYILREFSVIHIEREQELSVTQFQFTGWPEQGVPKRQVQFVEFVAQVLDKEPIQVGPVVVHCSAGVGRTAVYIMVDTAVALMEANQPVRPLDLVKIMREQRPGMVQTAEQYIFVCEVIIKLYEKLTKGQMKRTYID